MLHGCIPHFTDTQKWGGLERKIGPRQIQSDALTIINTNFMISGNLKCVTGGFKLNPSQSVFMFFLLKQRNSSLFMSLRLHQPIK